MLSSDRTLFCQVNKRQDPWVERFQSKHPQWLQPQLIQDLCQAHQARLPVKLLRRPNEPIKQLPLGLDSVESRQRRRLERQRNRWPLLRSTLLRPLPVPYLCQGYLDRQQKDPVRRLRKNQLNRVRLRWQPYRQCKWAIVRMARLAPYLHSRCRRRPVPQQRWRPYRHAMFFGCHGQLL